MRGLLDTSVFVAREQGRPLGRLPDEAAVSVVTLAELHLGVLLAEEPRIRSVRLHTLSTVERTFDALPVDDDVARAFAVIVAEARRKRARPKIMDAWIAATAVANHIPVFTQDTDFASFLDVEVLQV